MIAALVDPQAVGLVAFVGDPNIEIAISIEVTERDLTAIGVAESLTTVGIGAGNAALIAALIDPHAVGFEFIHNTSVDIAIAIEVAEGDTDAKKDSESLTTVGIGAGSAALIAALIDPHAVGLEVVHNPSIEIAIAIEVAESDTGAIVVTESLSTVGIGAGSATLITALIDPHAIGLACVCNPGIEIAIAIEVAESDTGAIVVTESLSTVGIGAGSATLITALIDPHAVGLIYVCNPSIEITIAIEVTKGNTTADGVAESLTTIGIGAGSATLIATLVDPHAVGYRFAAVGHPSIEIAIVIEVTESDIEAPGVAVTAVRKQLKGAIGIITIDEGIAVIVDTVGTYFGDLGVAGCGNS